MASVTVLPRIPEILRLICEELEDDKPALATLARTSKDFQDPALNVLWFELDNFYPLAKCLPSHTWVEARRYDEDEEDEDWLKLVLREPISLHDCARLLHYASRVRRLICDFDFDTDLVDNTLFQGLQIALHGIQLFPNLLVLRWNSSKDESNHFPVIPMLLGSRLTSVDVTLFKGCPWQISLLPVLRRSCPLLEEVSLHFPSSLRDDSSEESKQNVIFICKSISNWHSLQKLQVPDLTYSALLVVAQFPSLRSLKLSQCRLDNRVSVATNNGFPSLRELVIHSRTSANCQSVINLMDSSPVIDVKLKFYCVENAESWNTLFNSMVDHFDHAELRTLSCSDGELRDTLRVILDPPGPKREIIHFQDIEPLLLFRNIKELDLFVVRGFYFPDPSITKIMATSWKTIEALRLLVSHGPIDPQEAAPTCTLNDLLPFAEHCPQLKELGLPLDATSLPLIPMLHGVENRRPRQLTLTTLYVVEGRIENLNVPLVAANLSGIFPSLREIHYLAFRTQRADNGEEGRRPFRDIMVDWMQVERLVRVFSAVRAEEQLYITDQ